MAEYIEKQLVLSKSQQDYLEGRYDYDDFVLVSDIESIPPADVWPVVRGRWEISCDGWYPYCPVCKEEPPGRTMTPFCPMCGADLRGGDADGEEKDWPHAPDVTREFMRSSETSTTTMNFWRENEMAELKPCPFCGGVAITKSGVHVEPVIDPETGAYIDADTYYYEQTGCPACDIWFFIEEDESEDATIKKWNRRAGEDG